MEKLDIPLERLVESVENSISGFNNIGELDDLAGGEYTWEAGYEQSWNNVKLGERGQLLVYRDDGEDLKWLKKRHQETQRKIQDGKLIRRTLVRNLFVVLDFTQDSTLKDYKPNRTSVFVDVLVEQLKLLFQSAPLLTVCLIAVTDRIAHVVIQPTSHMDVIRAGLDRIINPRVATLTPEGNMSVYNGIERAITLLASHPDYATREILLLMSSIQTVDPYTLDALIPDLVSKNIRVSVVTLCAEVHAVKQICDMTDGIYRVALDLNHLKICMNAALTTSASNAKHNNQLLPVALVHPQVLPCVQLCLCHQTAVVEVIKCPRCAGIYCSAPLRCHFCEIILVLVNDIYRISLAYEMLFEFSPETIAIPLCEDPDLYDKCQSCDSVLYVTTRKGQESTENLQYRCDSCTKVFCKSCHAFMTETLHRCYGCETDNHFVTKGMIK